MYACSTCQQSTQIPNKDIYSLPKNVALQSAIEHLERVQASKQVFIATQATETCSEHMQKLVLVCMQDREMCCLQCAQHGKHKEHKILDIKHAASEFHKDVSNLRIKLDK